MTSPAASSAGPVSGARPGPVVDQRLEDRVAVLTMQSAPHNVLDAALVEALLSGPGQGGHRRLRAGGDRGLPRQRHAHRTRLP